MTDLYPKEVGKATHYLYIEGGKWFPWIEKERDARRGIFAVKFESGYIWDSKIGWRYEVKKTDERIISLPKPYAMVLLQLLSLDLSAVGFERTEVNRLHEIRERLRKEIEK